jgi:hypothetical protein
MIRNPRPGSKRSSALYVNRPNHAIVLSVDEKGQIQALDRTQRGAADEEGTCRHHHTRLQASWRHDAVRSV